LEKKKLQDLYKILINSLFHCKYVDMIHSCDELNTIVRLSSSSLVTVFSSFASQTRQDMGLCGRYVIQWAAISSIASNDLNELFI
jgi:hypothetical protein